jgi:hypothetical protein
MPRKRSNHVADRHQYYKDYYQANKEAIKKRRKLRDWITIDRMTYAEKKQIWERARILDAEFRKRNHREIKFSHRHKIKLRQAKAILYWADDFVGEMYWSSTLSIRTTGRKLTVYERRMDTGFILIPRAKHFAWSTRLIMLGQFSGNGL